MHYNEGVFSRNVGEYINDLTISVIEDPTSQAIAKATAPKKTW